MAFETSGHILIVDDEEPVRTLLADYLASQGYKVDTAANGLDALEALSAGRFDLVVSDIRMPGLDGMALLSRIRLMYPDAGVLLLTGCEDVSVAVDAMKTGALDYILKPFQLPDVGASVERALARQRETRREAEHVQQLERVVREQGAEVRNLLSDLREASEGTLDALVAALDAREHETQAHSKRVSEYTVHLASIMGVQGGELEVFRHGALLHDIGKIGISDAILLKPDRLTEAEWEEMRKHPQIGHWILNGIERLRPAAEIVLSHHERYDGLGYPRKLKGDEIPLGARIFSVVDCMDAITSDRPYHRGKPYSAARREIESHSGSQFDPGVVQQFLRLAPETWADVASRVNMGQHNAPLQPVPAVSR
jgi:putative nucleotidyltransferase with HDIG domain